MIQFSERLSEMTFLLFNKVEIGYLENLEIRLGYQQVGHCSKVTFEEICCYTGTLYRALVVT